MLLDYMRKNMKRFLIGIIVLIVPAFVLWGTVPSLGEKRTRTLIKVGGEKVTLEQFSNYYQNLREITRMRLGTNYTPELEELLNLRQQTMDSMIRDILLAQEADRLGIVVSDEEVQDSLKRNPGFYTDGKFDPAKWNELLNNPRVNWAVLVEEERERLRNQKFVEMVASAARVTEEEVREEYLRRHEEAKIEFVAFKASELAAEIDVSPDDMASYYEQHKQEYTEPAQVKLAYVEFKKDPSPMDYEDVKSVAQAILDRVREGDDFAELAKYSDDEGTRDKGGDLGFFGRGRMVKEFEEVAFSLEPGQVSDLVRSPFGYHIIKVEEIRGEGADKEVRARHMLAKVEPSEDTLDSLEEQAMRLSVGAANASLEQAASEGKVDLSTTPLFAETSIGIPDLGIVREISEILPGLDEGKPSDIIKTEKAFYVVEVRERVPERVPGMEEVQEKVEEGVRKEKALALAESKAKDFLEKVETSGLSFSDIEDGPKPLEAVPFSRNGYPSELPFIKGLVNAVFDLAAGKAAGPFVGKDTAYAILLKEKIAPDPADYESQKGAISDRLLADREQQVFQDYYENLREAAGPKIDETLLGAI